MKSVAFFVAAALASTSQAALAGSSFEDYARVKDVAPQYERVNLPRKECYSEYVPEARPQRDSMLGPLIGGVAGGLLGSTVGRGNGRIASSAAGAAVGAIVGDRLSRRNGPDDYYEREVRRCRWVDNWENRIIGYRVAYEYQGHNYTAILPYDPGNKLLVRVNVDPISRSTDRGDDYDQEWRR